MAYGLLSTGFSPKPLVVIRADLDDACRGIWGSSVPLGDKTLLGGYNGIVAERLSELWELGEAIDSSQDPDAATGAAEDAVCALTGTIRLAATPSSDTLTLTGNPATAITTGSIAATLSTGAQFATTEDAVLAALDAWTNTTGYTAGDRVTNNDGSTDRCYVCITTGTSAGSGGPVTTTADETDGTAHWRFLGEGTATADAASECVVDGPTTAVSGDVTVIITPVSGWRGVINLLDADLGTLDETDAALRLRREEELAADDASVPDAIREALLKVDDVVSATVFYNDTDATDGDGVPPHSVECLVLGGLDQDVADAIFAHVAAGIGTYGSTSATVTDSEGTSQTVSFSRPTPITIYVDVTLKYDATLYPTDGDAQVKAAIVAFGDLSATGKDAVAVAIGAQAFKVAGVLDVPRAAGLGGTLIKVTAGPTSDVTIAVGRREIATYDTSRIAIHSSAATP